MSRRLLLDSRFTGDERDDRLVICVIGVMQSVANGWMYAVGVRIEPEQGSGDDTAMNGVKVRATMIWRLPLRFSFRLSTTTHILSES